VPELVEGKGVFKPEGVKHLDLSSLPVEQQIVMKFIMRTEEA